MSEDSATWFICAGCGGPIGVYEPCFDEKSGELIETSLLSLNADDRRERRRERCLSRRVLSAPGDRRQTLTRAGEGRLTLVLRRPATQLVSSERTGPEQGDATRAAAYPRVTVSVLSASREGEAGTDHAWRRVDGSCTSSRAGGRRGHRELVLGCSPGTRYARLLGSLKRLDPGTLAELGRVDHCRHEAIAAIAPDGATVGIARFIRLADPAEAEVAMTVVDAWQGRGSPLCSSRGWLGRRAPRACAASEGRAWRQTARRSGSSEGWVR
jgi:hypothetical protein